MRIAHSDYPGLTRPGRSSLAEAIDYYFVKGPRMDDVIAGYRSITGRVLVTVGFTV